MRDLIDDRYYGLKSVARPRKYPRRRRLRGPASWVDIFRGAAAYAYNPWIEARFSPADLPDSLPGLDPNGQPAGNDHGVQTNCMSCHAQATYNPNRLPTAPRFAGARYVDLADPKFLGTLQVDFLWSIARHAK